MLQNARLKNMFKLSSKVTIYVPSTTDINVEIDNTEYVNKTAELLTNCFGGATRSDALGYWLSPSMGLVKEKTVLVYTNCKEKDLSDNIDKVIDWCEEMKNQLKQDTVAIEINGEMYFI